MAVLAALALTLAVHALLAVGVALHARRSGGNPGRWVALTFLFGLFGVAGYAAFGN